MVDFQDIVNYFMDPHMIGYTTEKTIVLAIFFVIGVYVIYEILKRLNIKIDIRFAVAIAPFIVLGSILRVLVDSNVISSYPFNIIFVTPNIYLVIGLYVLSLLLFSVFLERKRGIAYHKIMFIVGLLSVALSILSIQFVNLQGILLASAFISPWLLFALLFKKWSLENRFATFTQMIDANVTYVTLSFFGAGGSSLGYVEQHFIPSFLINSFGPFSFIVVKAVAIIVFLVLIDRFSSDKNFNSYIKLMVAILGAATGGRDLLRLAAFV